MWALSPLVFFLGLPASQARSTSVPVFADVRVGHILDDAEENSGGGMALNTAKLELGQQQYVGTRFPNVIVPPGATILNAHVEFRATDPNSESTNLTSSSHSRAEFR